MSADDHFDLSLDEGDEDSRAAHAAANDAEPTPERRKAFEETIGENYRPDWPTPQTVLAPVHEFAAPVGGVTLDPCSNPSSIVGAAINLMLEEGDDGLTENWIEATAQLGGIVFMNPPYGREIKAWIAKAVAEAARGVEIVGLVPGRVDTRWFSQLFATCDAIGFWKGRLKFLGAPDPAKFPSVVPYWGRRVEGFERVFGRYCNVVRPSRARAA